MKINVRANEKEFDIYEKAEESINSSVNHIKHDEIKKSFIIFYINLWICSHIYVEYIFHFEKNVIKNQ